MYSSKLILSVLLFFYLLFTVPALKAQTIPINSIQDQQLKLQYLLKDSTQLSLVERPFSYSIYEQHFSSQTVNNFWDRPIQHNKIQLNDQIELGIHPIFIQNTINTRYPKSENNAAAWYGRGLNSEIIGGFYLRSSFLTVDIRPHLIYQQNKDFMHPRFVMRRNGEDLFQTTEYRNFIDLPFRFGSSSYTTINSGSSSVRLNYKSLETGISTEPLWWGPANHYPLMMSNNSAGVPHYFLRSREAIKIPYIGKISFRWMLGYPNESEYFEAEVSGRKRFFNAINLSYKPFNFNNLTFGVTRAFHMYQNGRLTLDQVASILGPLRKIRLIKTQGDDEERESRNQMISAYVELRLPGANAQIYGEFYREDHSFNFRDFFNEPRHNSAYAFGFQKILMGPLADFYKLNLEMTNLTISQLQQVRPQANYYSHTRIQQGHTNNGQVLGAAIGPGSNSQYIEIEAYRKNYRFGFFIQRLVNNDNFHLLRGSASLNPSRDFGDYFRHRVDLNTGLNVLYGFEGFYLNSRIIWTKAYNYGRFDLNKLEGVNINNFERNDRINIQFQVGITYIL